MGQNLSELLDLYLARSGKMTREEKIIKRRAIMEYLKASGLGDEKIKMDKFVEAAKKIKSD